VDHEFPTSVLADHQLYFDFEAFIAQEPAFQPTMTHHVEPPPVYGPGASFGPRDVTPAPPTVVGERFTCSNGCGKSFRRAGDCRRHMLKHGPPKFKCAVIDCDMTFYRADKLRAHLKQGHKITL
jgi:hypothetical protein